MSNSGESRNTSSISLELRKAAKSRLNIGKLGEQAAVKFIESQNFKVIFKNWRCPEGELDIIAIDKSTLVIIEVKTRLAETSHNFSPFEAIDSRKEAQLKRVANRLVFLERLKIKPYHPTAIRFDAVGVLYSLAGGTPSFTFHHLQDAFSY